MNTRTLDEIQASLEIINTRSEIMRRFILLIFILTLFFSLIGCSKTNQTNNVVEDELVTNSISFGLGGDLNKTIVTYQFNLWNKTRKSILIKSVEPIISNELSNRVEDSNLIIEVNKLIEGSKSENFSGSFSLNTKGLTKQEIEKLNIQLKKFRIISEQEISIETN